MPERLEIAIKRTRTMLERSKHPGAIGRPGYIYVMRLSTHKNAYLCPYKIGQSIDPHARRDQLAAKQTFDLEVLHSFLTDNMDLAEYKLHVAYEEMRLQDEWFTLNRLALEQLININQFYKGIFLFYRDPIALPEGFWDGLLDLPF